MSLLKIILIPVTFLSNLCRKKKEKYENPVNRSEEFLTACTTGNLPKVLEHVDFCDQETKNMGLLEACRLGFSDMAECIMEKGGNNLDEALRVSCKNGRCSCAEKVARRGANIYEGIKNTSSQNITRMLFRVSQKTENIS